MSQPQEAMPVQGMLHELDPFRDRRFIGRAAVGGLGVLQEQLIACIGAVGGTCFELVTPAVREVTPARLERLTANSPSYMSSEQRAGTLMTAMKGAMRYPEERNLQVVPRRFDWSPAEDDPSVYEFGVIVESSELSSEKRFVASYVQARSRGRNTYSPWVHLVCCACCSQMKSQERSA